MTLFLRQKNRTQLQFAAQLQMVLRLAQHHKYQ